MDHSQGFTIAALAISSVALVASIASAIASWRTSTKQNELQGRIADIETARERDRLRASRSGVLVAAIEREVENWTATHVRAARVDHFLTLTNEGAAGAKDIKVTIDGKPAKDHHLVVGGELGVTTLGAGARVKFRLSVTQTSPRVIDVALDWRDDSGEPGHWESQLRLL